jgi:hypothetical protein
MMAINGDQRHGLAERIATIEESYEFMLAYAARGCQGDEEPCKGESIREFLLRADAALEGLGEAATAVFRYRGLISTEPCRKFLEVLDQDARKAQAIIQMVLSLSSISSQLIDNVNSSIHIRTMLTDLFLIDETIKAN